MVYEKKYSWRSPKNVSAQIVGEVIEQIEKEDGAVTKEKLLEVSRPEDSPTHRLFEWDDSVAAEKYRLHQSQKAILDIVVTVVKNDEPQLSSRAFVNVTSGLSNKAQYSSIDVAMADEEKRNAVLDNAFEEFRKFEDKYNSLRELSAAFDEMHKAEKQHKARRKRAKKND